jgi:hypothetical protein
MKRRILTMLTVVALVVVLLPAAAMANGNSGQAIGQDPLRLALTQCSNAGPGDGAELEAGFLGKSVDSDCLDKRFFSRYSGDEIAAIYAQSTCFLLFPLFGVCEVDPGNSAAHNANNN